MKPFEVAVASSCQSIHASQCHSLSAQRFTGPELDFYAWGNDFFRSMIKWRHAKVEAESPESLKESER